LKVGTRNCSEFKPWVRHLLSEYVSLLTLC